MAPITYSDLRATSGLIKNFAIAEKIKLQLLAEAFNLTDALVFG
jgi:hypothetical protein